MKIKFQLPTHLYIRVLRFWKSRAKHLVDHLLGKENNPYFREKDTIQTKRALFRKALATVAQMEENVTADSHHHLVSNGEVIVEDKYPLNNDGSN